MPRTHFRALVAAFIAVTLALVSPLFILRADAATATSVSLQVSSVGQDVTFATTISEGAITPAGTLQLFELVNNQPVLVRDLTVSGTTVSTTVNGVSRGPHLLRAVHPHRRGDLRPVAQFVRRPHGDQPEGADHDGASGERIRSISDLHRLDQRGRDHAGGDLQLFELVNNQPALVRDLPVSGTTVSTTVTGASLGAHTYFAQFTPTDAGSL